MGGNSLPPRIKAAEALKFFQNKKVNLSDALDIISFLSGAPYEDTRRNLDKIELDGKRFVEALENIMSHVPVAYITGRKEFYSREFAVNENTLIPRPETETLIDAVLKNVDKTKPLKILDLCTGSGCILLTLLKELPFASGTGVDISPEALLVAGENAKKLDTGGRAEFIQGDVLQELPLGTFDIITANPPYLSPKEYEGREPSLSYEPLIAIVTGDDGYLFYKKILCRAHKLSNNNALVFFEVGFTQAGEVVKIAENAGYRMRIETDNAGNNRVVWGESARG